MIDYDNPDRIFEAATRAFQARQFSEAESLGLKLSSLAPTHVGTKLLLANLAGLKGDSEIGGKFLSEALELDPTCLQALLGLANIASIRGELGEAINLCERAMKVVPHLGSPYFHLGRILLNARRFDEAAVRFERAVDFDPNLATLHHHLGLAYQGMGRGLDAAKEFQRAISLDPKSAASYAELGNLFLTNGNAQRAAECFKRAAFLQPDSARGSFLLAKALIEEKKFSEAEKALEHALKIDPQLTEAKVLLGRVLQQVGRFDEADNLLSHGLAGDELRADVVSVRFSGKTLTEEDRGTIEALEARANRGNLDLGELRTLSYTLGKAYDDFGQYGRAIVHFDRANQISQSKLDALGRTFDPVRRRAETLAVQSNFGEDFFEKSKSLGNGSEVPIFIVGMPRSGTTLLEQIISSHPEVTGAGELGGWPELFSGPFQRPDPVPSRGEVQALASSFLMRLGASGNRSRYITEKSPQNFMILGPILTTFPNAHILHCKRSPLDTCISIFTTPFNAGADFAHDRNFLACAYLEYLRVMEHWRRVLPSGRLLEVQYEDLIADREPVLRGILEFLGLKWSDSCLHHELNQQAISTPSLWQARQPIFSRSVGRWRNYEPWLGSLNQLRDL